MKKFVLFPAIATFLAFLLIWSAVGLFGDKKDRPEPSYVERQAEDLKRSVETFKPESPYEGGGYEVLSVAPIASTSLNQVLVVRRYDKAVFSALVSRSDTIKTGDSVKLELVMMRLNNASMTQTVAAISKR